MKIATVEAFPLMLPFRGTFRIARGMVGSSRQGRTVVLVKVTTESGQVGWGDSSPSVIWSAEHHESVVAAIRHYIAPAVAGLPLADLDGLHRAMNRAIAPTGFGTGMPIAKAGVDIAVYDALGKTLGIPLWQLLGYRRQNKVTLSWTVAPADLREAERVIGEGFERGYRHFNIKLGAGLEEELAMCRMVRERSPHSFLWGDANGALPPHSVVMRARRLQEAGLELLEQPVAGNNISAWQELRTKVDIPIAVDETICGPTELIELIRLNAVSAFVLKATRMGGIFPSRQCLEVAQAAGLMLVGSGLTDCGVGLAANLHLVAAFGIRHPVAANGPQFLADDILATPLKQVGDQVDLPDGPGLGITVDEEKVKHYAVEL